MALLRDLRLGSAARRLSRALAREEDLAALFGLVRGCRPLRPTQVESEFLAFLARVRSLRAARIVEIGTGRGGTSILLARAAAPGAVVVTVDLAHPRALRRRLPRLAPPGGRIVVVSGDSGDPVTVRAVKDAAGGPLDVLLIDGDHSYEGVRRDHETYGPLVRPGGLVAFHDIVPDHAQRFGRPTSHDTGGVPRYWREKTGADPDCPVVEIVADPGQDGFGIGILGVRE